MRKKEITVRNTKPKKDLTGQQFGYLTPIYWIKGKGWKCKCKCGNETIVSTAYLTTGHTTSCGCKRYETKNLINMLNYEDEYIKVIGLEEKVKGKSPKWVCECKICGRRFLRSGSHIRNYDLKSCGCVHSQGEQIIISLLDKYHITYSKEYTFEDLIGINGGKLRFDFAIFDSNNKLLRLIEFNGSQHYEKPNGTWSNGFETMQIHDKLKREYCEKNSIELRIVRYDEDICIEKLI